MKDNNHLNFTTESKASPKRMRVIKRNGTMESVSFDKVLQRIEKFCDDLKAIDPHSVAQKVCARIFDGVKTAELDELTAQLCSSMITDHPDYGTLASRIIISNHHKNTSPSFSETMSMLFNAKNESDGSHMPLISDELWEIVQVNREKLNNYIVYDRDYTFDFFGFKTLERSYLLRINDKVVERPQHMIMRVALGIHKNDFKDALATYDAISQKLFTHATPTLFNAGTRMPSLISCFLLGMEDSIEGIFETAKRSAAISKGAGGIGIHAHAIRARGSKIRSTNGQSSGLIPFLRIFNELAKAVDQAGKRKGSIAVYLEPWHADIEAFLQIRRNNGGNPDEKCLDLFSALCIPSLFFKKVQENADWCLFCPSEVGEKLVDAYGDEFDALYHKLEAEGKYKKKIPAQKLFMDMIKSCIETGTPYMMCKDAMQKSNQKNLGTIRSSNLCVAPETMILTEQGYFPIAQLEGQPIRVWNGEVFSDTVVHKTGVDQKLLTVKFDNGCSLRCTPYHKFYIETSETPSVKSKVVVVEAKDLESKMRLIRFDVPTINSTANGGEKLKYAYTQGLFAADGTYSKAINAKGAQCGNKQNPEFSPFCKRHQRNVALFPNENNMCCAETRVEKPMLWLYGEKKQLIEHIEWDYMHPNDNCDRLDVALPHDIESKYLVPVNHDLQSKLRWLEGFLDGDGCVLTLNGLKNIQATSIHLAFLKDIMYMLQTLGVSIAITKARNARKTELPDGRGGSKDYDCKEVWRFNIDCASLIHLKDLGFSPKRLDINDIRPPHHKTNRYTRVAEVEDNGDIADTFCFTEPLKNMGVFNGVLAGNCAEIVQYSNGTTEIASCNLASMVLPSYVFTDANGNPTFDFERLHSMVQMVTKNLNKVIDVTMYPHPAAEASNFRHRPIGIGVQGLGDAFILLRLPFESPEAAELNKKIFETIYHAAITESMLIAKKRSEMVGVDEHRALFTGEELQLQANGSKWPGAYVSFEGSPASQGTLQFDMWGATPPTDRYDWPGLKQEIQKYGLRNSLLVALMPTASTSQIMGSVAEMFEPITSNIYQRRTLAGEFVVVNKYLIKDLIELGLWDNNMKNKILLGDGSVQHIHEIPVHIRALYKTSYEIKQKAILDMSAARSIYVCQSSSQNLYFAESSIDKISNAILYGWKLGLKTLMYYARVQTKAKIAAFSLDPKLIADHQAAQQLQQATEEAVLACRRDNPEGCIMCSA
jgi:ribonucleoside-diphosphate reductase alpha chain